MKKIAWLVLTSLFLLASPVRAGISLLHEFAGGIGDGARPIDSLLISGSTLYGMTKSGGGSDLGTIFKVQDDGTGFTLLHEFAGGATDGATPYGSLILSGSTLFGMTAKGGDRDLGTVFKIETNGSGFIILHSFAGGAADGANPNGSLVLSGSTLYGMTCNGGNVNFGTVFKIGTGGTGFALLHEFSGSVDDGKMPRGSLTLSGTTLYGMTYGGGEGDNGTVFSIQSNGSGFTLLHKFAHSDGANPYGALTLSGTTLFGMTLYGGYYGMGTIFKMQTNGSGFALLHEFTGSTDDGGEPYGSLFLAGSTLYGMSLHGGIGFRGTIFTIGTDGGGFYPWHQFLGGADDGTWPYGSLILSGSNLYGMTRQGGDNDLGVVFSLPMPSWTVTSPNGGENWQAGSDHEITWTADGDMAYVNIDYSINNGVTWIPVADHTLNDGSFSWTVPAVHSAACRVRVGDVIGASSDCSDANFSIYEIIDLAVTAPSSAMPWEKGRTYQVAWLKQGTQNANVKINLYKGTSILVLTLSAKTANDGSFDWTVPKTLAAGDAYFVRVQTVDNSLKDDSDKFSIIVPTITVTSPSSGAVWVRNTAKTITWNKTGTQDANVRIQLFKDGVKKLDITPGAPNSGSHDWAIPATLASGVYTIRVTTLDGKVKGTSKNFTIARGLIRVMEPSAGALWQRGVLHAITWSGEGTLNASVKIQLFKGTTLVKTIIATTANDGSFDWTIPASQALAANYRIRVTTVDGMVAGQSGLFTITNGGG